MYLTEREIADTPVSLARTYAYFLEKKPEIEAFFAKHRQRKFAFLGCGSSYMLAKGAAALFQSLPDTAACAVPAGDFLVNPDFWKNTLKDSIVVSLSRSGRTSEVVRAVKAIRASGCPVISLCMRKENDISPFSELEFIMDWCYDESVCQTRTVTNLYAGSLLLAAAYSSDGELTAAVAAACNASRSFQEANRPMMEKIAALDWDRVVVLADGPLCGIAEEGALAFTEIAMISGSWFHLLDYRHGPVVISGPKTLTLVLAQPGEDALQSAMVRELAQRGGPVVSVSELPGNPWGTAAHITIEGVSRFAAWGVPFIYLCQMLALLKALELGGNPDAPAGLNAYIVL